MDYRLDRVRIIKDADNKVIVANRGFFVCLHFLSFHSFVSANSRYCQKHEASKTGNSRTGGNCYQCHTVDPGYILSHRFDATIECEHFLI